MAYQKWKGNIYKHVKCQIICKFCQIVMLEKTLESLLDCKEKKPVNPKGNQPWIFIGRAVAEAPVFGHLMRRANSLEKTLMLDTGKDWNQKEKGVEEAEMVR